MPTGSVAFTVDGVTGLNNAVQAKVRAIYTGDGAFEGSAGSTTVTVTYAPTSDSVVVPLVTPNPVVADGYGQWPYRVALIERGGVATMLTSFSADSEAHDLSLWTSTSLPAKGTIYANLVHGSMNDPANRQFIFSGNDADGRAWTQRVTVPFVTGPATASKPGITLTTATPTVPQNPLAPSGCQWAQQISVQETGGFYALLSSRSRTFSAPCSWLLTDCSKEAYV